MRIVLPGGSGQVGTTLARAFHAADHSVTVLSRRPRAAPWRVVAWDGRTRGDWAHTLEGADLVVNLAGYTVNCRYSARNRERILRSRIESTRAVAEALAACGRPPRTWLQASTATIYAHRFDAPNDEAKGVLGGGEPGAPASWRFSIEVARAWERAAEAVALGRTRCVRMRSAMIMSPDPGGIFATLLGLVRGGLGGPIAGGRQFISWIHHEDFVRAVEWLHAHEELSGPVNLASPEPLPQSAFMAALRDAWGARIGLPATRWMLEAGAWALRTESELVLKSRRVVPGRLLQSGFRFCHPAWPAAARELCDAWRGRRPAIGNIG